MARWHVNSPGKHGPCAGDSSSSSSIASGSQSTSEERQKQGIVLNCIGLTPGYSGAVARLELDCLGHLVSFDWYGTVFATMPTREPGLSPDTLLCNPSPRPPTVGHQRWKVNDAPKNNTDLISDIRCAIPIMFLLLDIASRRPRLEEMSSSADLSSSEQSSSLSDSETCPTITTQGHVVEVLALHPNTHGGMARFVIDSVAGTVKVLPSKKFKGRRVRMIKEITCAGSNIQATFQNVVFPPGYLFCCPFWRKMRCGIYNKLQPVYPLPGTIECESVLEVFGCCGLVSSSGA